ncbi:MAG: hypothetical protein NXI24_22205 [bacterium]|nr:hypothetical protein [bacterium]
MLNRSLLKFHTDDPQTYLECARFRRWQWKDSKRYWSLLPVYTIARCPICDSETREPIDTYSLRTWELENHTGKSVHSATPAKLITHCKHFVCVQAFINFNGQRPQLAPTELEEPAWSSSERPHVMGVDFEEDDSSRAVIHSLPLCKIVEGAFEARYAIYFVTHFSKRAADIAPKILSYDHFYESYDWERQRRGWSGNWEWFDLKRHASEKRLLWLEPNNPEFILQNDASRFPYGDIQGRLKPYWNLYPFTLEEASAKLHNSSTEDRHPQSQPVRTKNIVPASLQAVQDAVAAIREHKGGPLPLELKQEIRTFAASGMLGRYLRCYGKGLEIPPGLRDAEATGRAPESLGSWQPRTLSAWLGQENVQNFYLEIDSHYGDILLYFIIRDANRDCRALLAHYTNPLIFLGQPEQITFADLDEIQDAARPEPAVAGRGLETFYAFLEMHGVRPGRSRGILGAHRLAFDEFHAFFRRFLRVVDADAREPADLLVEYISFLKSLDCDMSIPGKNGASLSLADQKDQLKRLASQFVAERISVQDKFSDPGGTQNASLLQIDFTPHRYLELCQNAWSVAHWRKFWPVLPKYTIARCPFCDEANQVRIDTYSLRSWRWEEANGRDLQFYSSLGFERCDHFEIVHPFLNLNGHRPELSLTELVRPDIAGPEKPHVMPPAFEVDPGCKAVLHSLPVCKIVNNRFEPRYTWYFVTYFSEKQPRGSLSWAMSQINSGRKYNREPSLLGEAHARDDWWDLEKWVRKGHLLWLKPDDPESSLQADRDDFPYANITGRVQPYQCSYPFSAEEIAAGMAADYEKEQLSQGQPNLEYGEIYGPPVKPPEPPPPPPPGTPAAAVRAIQDHPGGPLPEKLLQQIETFARSGELGKYLRREAPGEWFPFHLYSPETGDTVPPAKEPGAFAYRLAKPNANLWYLEMDTITGEFYLYSIVRDRSDVCWALLANPEQTVIRLGKPDEISAYDLDVIFNTKPPNNNTENIP